MALDPLELTAGLAIGTGLGGGIADVVTPRLQDFKNTQWAKYPNVPPGAGTLAAGVAQGQVDPTQAAKWAMQTGYGAAQFQALIDIANVGPGAAYAFELWRRGQIDDPGFRRALKRLGLEQEWIDDLVAIKQRLLSPAELAVMVQRGVVPDPGYLPVGPPTKKGQVPPMPVAQVDTTAEAAGSGYDFERMAALTRIIGLPASPDLAARMTFRGIIDPVDFDRAISEGNTRNEWAPFLFEGFRQIPTAEQFVEAHLRGWITQPEMYQGTALHGMSKPDTDLEFQIHRRPLTVHAIKQALARGGQFNPAPGEIQDPYTASVHQANLGPEWYDLATHLAGSYPSLFITSRLVTAGTITPATGQTWLQKSGTADEVVTAMYASWTGAGGGASADPHVKKAQTSLFTEAHKAYVKGGLAQAQVTPALDLLAVPAAAQAQVFTLWDAEKQLVALAG